MTPAELSRLLARAGVVLALIAVAIGRKRWTDLSPAVRGAWWWMLVDAVEGALVSVLSLNHIKTLPVVLWARPVLAIVACFGLGALFESASFRRWARAGLVLYLMIWLVGMLDPGELGDYSAFLAPSHWLYLSVLGCLVIVARVRHPDFPGLRDAGLLIGIGTVISYAPSVVIEPAAKVLYPAHREVVLGMFTARSVLLLLGYCLYTLAMLWTPRRRT